MEKLTQEELTLVQDFNNKTNQITIEIGQIEIKKQLLIDELKFTNESFKSTFDELSEKYGDCNIDVNTGEITKKENGEN
jgi:hypothetical protein